MANPFVKAWKYLMALFSSKVDEYADPKVQIQQAIEDAQRQQLLLVAMRSLDNLHYIVVEKAKERGVAQLQLFDDLFEGVFSSLLREVTFSHFSLISKQFGHQRPETYPNL